MSDEMDRPGQWSARALLDALKDRLAWQLVAIELAAEKWGDGEENYKVPLDAMKKRVVGILEKKGNPFS